MVKCWKRSKPKEKERKKIENSTQIQVQENRKEKKDKSNFSLKSASKIEKSELIALKSSVSSIALSRNKLTVIPTVKEIRANTEELTDEEEEIEEAEEGVDDWKSKLKLLLETITLTPGDEKIFLNNMISLQKMIIQKSK